MKILIAGASGFIGKGLTKSLMQDNQLTVLGRDRKRLEKAFPENIEIMTWDELEKHQANQFDVVINLSGSNIAAKRWNSAVKQELIDSRVLTNKRLIDWLIQGKAAPHYYSANAVGIYGAHDADGCTFDEDSDPTKIQTQDFLKEIGLAWAASVQPAIDHGIKTTVLQFGVVLKKNEGMLKKLALPFSLGLGSTLGTGEQIISWVHYQDVVKAILFLLAHPDITGSVNITSPNPIKQKSFALQLANVFNRPCFLTTPAFVVKALFGEMGDCLLLKGQKVMPKRLLELGYQFSYPDLPEALREEYKQSR